MYRRLILHAIMNPDDDKSNTGCFFYSGLTLSLSQSRIKETPCIIPGNRFKKETIIIIIVMDYSSENEVK